MTEALSTGPIKGWKIKKQNARATTVRETRNRMVARFFAIRDPLS
jgi:hypothetical protein